MYMYIYIYAHTYVFFGLHVCGEPNGQELGKWRISNMGFWGLEGVSRREESTMTYYDQNHVEICIL